MPVQPIPCADGGTGTPGACSCAPSIATSPLCREDGTTILVVVRSACASCGTAAPDPAVVGWVDPITGTFTAGPVPADAGPCTGTAPDACSCAPSITSMPLCRADGTTIALIIRSACTDCGTDPVDPGVVGWLDPVTGLFTAGPAPADAQPCQLPGCLDTICRQRCDDTNGDGEADATYTELYCVRPDGTVDLLLTYQDDPGVPYTPVAPVECTYGCPETETLQLCDDSGPFLRRYTWLNGLATFEDVALDGQTPHIVTGTVGACTATSEPGEDCVTTVCRTRCDDANNDGEADTTYSELWCVHADGTAEIVLTYQDDPSVPYTPLAPVDCAYASETSETLTLCDDSGPFLRRYSWLGDVASFEDFALDGLTPHVVTGTVGLCPAGVAQPEHDLVQLCDVAADGTATEFVRDYARDENGAISGHTDYLLDGAPYVATGTVGTCGTEPAPCLDCTTQVLCDTVPGPAATLTGTTASGTLFNGVGYAVTAPGAFAPTNQSDGAAWWGSALFPNPFVPLTTYTFDRPVTAEFSVVIVHTTSGTAAGTNQVQLPPGAVPISLPTGYTFNWTTRVLTADASLVGCTPLTAPTRATSARFRISGVQSFALQYKGPRALLDQCRRFGNWVFGAVDVSLGGPFLRTVCRDCDGAAVSATDTLLDGETPYTPVGEVGLCPVEEEGAEPVEPDTEVLQLCDLAADADPVPFLRRLTFPAGGGTPTVTDTTLDGVTPYTLTGTAGLCSAAEDCPANTVLQRCRCDDTDGDGIADTDYVEFLAVDCEGALTTLGTYTAELDAPYVPVAPIDCAETDEGAEVPIGVQARRVQLAAGETWNAEDWTTLQSVTAIAHGGTGTVTTADGASTLHTGEAATWSVGRDTDALLTGPLTITADTGTVTLSYTIGVTL